MSDSDSVSAVQGPHIKRTSYQVHPRIRRVCNFQDILCKLHTAVQEQKKMQFSDGENGYNFSRCQNLKSYYASLSCRYAVNILYSGLVFQN